MNNAKELAELLDHNRWLLNSGLVSDMTKNNLFLYGSLLHKEVMAVDMSVEVANHTIKYSIFVPATLITNIDRFKKLSANNSLWSLWKLRRLYKKHGNLDFSKVLTGFVHDYCGPKWSAAVEVLDYSTYVADYAKEEKQDGDHQRSYNDR